MHQLNGTSMQLNWLYAAFTNLSEYPHKIQCVQLLWIPFSPISAHEKAIPHMENHAHMCEMDLSGVMTV